MTAAEARHDGAPALPAGAEILEERRILGTVTHLRLRLASGAEVEWSSRGQRKRRPLRRLREAARGEGAPATGRELRRLALAIALLFSIGSCFFVTGAAGAVSDPSATWPNPLYFFGSVLFTCGGALQVIEARAAGRDLDVHADRRLLPIRLWIPGRLDWNASIIQFAGTLLFNINCFFGMNAALTAQQEIRVVWVPSTIASVCFVVASELALIEATGRWMTWRPHLLAWWITLGSLLGSLGFLISSLFGFVATDGAGPLLTGLLGANADADVVRWGVDGVLLIGSLFFLLGTALMIPEALAPASEPLDSIGGAAVATA